MVENRWAMITVVRPFLAAFKTCWTWISETTSRAAVGSSRIRIGESDEKGAGQGDPLSLAFGQFESTLTNDGLVTLR